MRYSLRVTKLALLLGMGTTASAQYQLYDWVNFEDGRVPEVAAPFGAHASTDMRIVDLEAVEQAGAVMRTEEARRETGRSALLLKADPRSSATQDFLMGLTVGNVLNRTALAGGGKALFQMDLYLPPAGTPVPELAVLAADAENRSVIGRVPRAFYRFGVHKNRVYYSRILPGQNTDYRMDAAFLDRIPRPGWHRMAIVLEGQDTIRCYIDGLEPSFSPVKDATLQRLQVGVMLAEDKSWYDSFVDNLSIQVGQDVALPESPYRKAAGAAGIPVVGKPGGIDWKNPQEAWAEAQQSGKPLLLYFVAPSVPATAELDRVLNSEPSAAEYVARYKCARVDVNQLQGGAIARQYGVFRVPTFLLVSADSQELARETFTREDTWATFRTRLP